MQPRNSGTSAPLSRAPYEVRSSNGRSRDARAAAPLLFICHLAIAPRLIGHAQTVSWTPPPPQHNTQNTTPRRSSRRHKRHWARDATAPAGNQGGRHAAAGWCARRPPARRLVPSPHDATQRMHHTTLISNGPAPALSFDARRRREKEAKPPSVARLLGWRPATRVGGDTHTHPRLLGAVSGGGGGGRGPVRSAATAPSAAHRRRRRTSRAP